MSIEGYVKAKQVALGRSLASRHKVYLDLNFWIVVRDAASGIRTDPSSQRLLSLLRSGVLQEKLVCPIADTIFVELMKQPFSDDRRLGTARLVDELSLGVSMMMSQRRVATEIAILVHNLLGRADTLHPMQELIWTKVCHVLGERYPVVRGLDEAILLDLQRGFIDQLWQSSLVQMVDLIGDRWDFDDGTAEISAAFNRERDEHAHEVPSFERAYEAEIAGIIDATGETIAGVLCGIGEEDGFEGPQHGGDAWHETENFGKNLLLTAFKNGDAMNIVRTIHIEASLHAAMCMDKQHPYEPNDIYDFEHASAALAYCDIFLTEKGLRDLVTRKKLDLTRLNDCKVASNPGQAIGLLEALVG